jgi:ABC-type glycerol-3-phosphate transport system substrate-binding protein
MKKVFLTLAVVLATSTVLVSCGGKKEASENASSEATTEEVVVEEAPVASPVASPEAAPTTKKDAPKK